MSEKPTELNLTFPTPMWCLSRNLGLTDRELVMRHAEEVCDNWHNVDTFKDVIVINEINPDYPDITLVKITGIVWKNDGQDD